MKADFSLMPEGEVTDSRVEVLIGQVRKPSEKCRYFPLGGTGIQLLP